jgi:hypothetical protein
MTAIALSQAKTIAISKATEIGVLREHLTFVTPKSGFYVKLF